jgi:hypothetical protein
MGNSTRLARLEENIRPREVIPEIGPVIFWRLTIRISFRLDEAIPDRIHYEHSV